MSDEKKVIFLKELKEQYCNAHYRVQETYACLQFLCGHISEHEKIKSSITGPECEAVLRLCIGAVLENFEYIYKVSITSYSEDGILDGITHQYVDSPEEYIDYDIFGEAPRDFEDFNPYTDLEWLEKYIRAIMSLSDYAKAKLEDLYKKLVEYNKLTILEKKKSLHEFSESCLDIEENDYLNEIFLEHRRYSSFEEDLEVLGNQILRAVSGVIRRIILYQFQENKANRNILSSCSDIFICFFDIQIMLFLVIINLSFSE